MTTWAIPASPSERGSALVEAMVAVAIIAMMLATTYRVLEDSLLRSKAAEVSRTATLVARSRLAALGAEAPLETGQTSGVEGSLVWRADVEPTSEPSSTIGPLLHVTVTVSDRAKGIERARLSTLRLGQGG
jgi:hypothetical protein